LFFSVSLIRISCSLGQSLISCLFHKPAAVHVVLHEKYSIEQSADPIDIKKGHNAPAIPSARPQTNSVVERDARAVAPTTDRLPSDRFCGQAPGPGPISVQLKKRVKKIRSMALALDLRPVLCSSVSVTSKKKFFFLFSLLFPFSESTYCLYSLSAFSKPFLVSRTILRD
jgi:hypothetical protein